MASASVDPTRSTFSLASTMHQAVPHFIGRGDELQHVIDELDRPADEGGALIVSISGVGGVGKTCLLRQVLRTRSYPALYVGADDRDGLLEVASAVRVLARRLANSLGPLSLCAQALAEEGRSGWPGLTVDVARLDEVGALSAAFIRDVNDAAASGRQVVLILDGYEAYRHNVGPWLLDTLLAGRVAPITGDLRLLIAGREPLQRTDLRWMTDWGSRIANVELEPFSLDETARFLHTVAGIKPVSNADQPLDQAELDTSSPPGTREIQRATPDGPALSPALTEAEVQAAYKLTGGLPVWLAFFRPGRGRRSQAIDLASAERVQAVVDRFLVWWSDPDQVRWVRTAWVPRWFNLEVLRALLDDDAEAAFEWLTRQAAVVRGERGRWRFHEVVRTALRQDAFQRAPDELAAQHDRLAAYWSQQHAAEPGTAALIEEVFHRLLGSDPTRGLAALCEAYLRASARGAPEAGAIVAAALAACDEAPPTLQVAVIHAVEAHWAATQAGDSERLAGARDRLLELDFLQPAERAILLGQRVQPAQVQAAGQPLAVATARRAASRGSPGWWRWLWSRVPLHRRATLTADERAQVAMLVEYGDSLRLAGQPEAALAPLSEALALSPDDAQVRISRGEAFRVLGRTAEALEDLTVAVRVAPRDAWAWTLRAAAHLSEENPSRALADAERAVKLDRRSAWALAVRGLAVSQMAQFPTPAALGDVRRALELDPSLDWLRPTLAEWEHLLATQPVEPPEV